MPCQVLAIISTLLASILVARQGRVATAGGPRPIRNVKGTPGGAIRGRTAAASGEVFLYEPRTEVDIQLHQRLVADAAEAVDLSRLDHQNVPGAGFEFHPVHRPEPAAPSHELHFIVGVAMRPGPAPGIGAQEEGGDPDVPIVRADELVGASDERQVLLANSMHPASLAQVSEALPDNGKHLVREPPPVLHMRNAPRSDEKKPDCGAVRIGGKAPAARGLLHLELQ